MSGRKKFATAISWGRKTVERSDDQDKVAERQDTAQ